MLGTIYDYSHFLRICTFFHAKTIILSCTRPIEPHQEKTCLRGFRPGLTQTWLYNHRSWLEAGNFGFRKKRDCTIYVAKTKALISCMATAAELHLFFLHMQKVGFLMKPLILTGPYLETKLDNLGCNQSDWYGISNLLLLIYI